MKRWPSFFILLLGMIFFYAGSYRHNSLQLNMHQEIGIQDAEMLYNLHPKSLMRDLLVPDKISQDGKKVGFLKEGNLWIYDLDSRETYKLKDNDKLDRVNGFEWQGSGASIRISGIKNGKQESVIAGPGEDEVQGISLNADLSDISVTPDQTAAWINWDKNQNKGGVYLKTAAMDVPELVLQDIYPFAMTFSNDGKLLAYVYPYSDSNMALATFDIKNEKTDIIAENLDGTENSRIGFSSDNQYIIISLAGDGQADLKEKHKPFADRDLDIFTISLNSGEINRISGEEGDDILVGINGDMIYWNIVKPVIRSVLVSLNDGKISPLISETAFMPRWDPKGKQIATTFGDWRIADFSLNWDLGSFSINKTGKVTGNILPQVQGYHEDLGLCWSPDGKWMSWQSHRTTIPVMFYGAEGNKAGIFLRSVDGGKEILLADHCIEAWVPSWSSDSKKIIFCGSVAESDPMAPWLITLNDNGQKEGMEKMVLSGVNGDVWNAVWSPDGNRIAFEVSDGSPMKSIWIAGKDGSGAYKLTDFECLTIVSGLDFSPDGKSVYFAAFDGGFHQIFKVSLESGEKTKVATASYDMIMPQVSPAGDFMAVTVFRNTRQLWRAKLSL